MPRMHLGREDSLLLKCEVLSITLNCFTPCKESVVSTNTLLSLYSVIVDMEIKRKICDYGENFRPVVVIVLTELYVNFTACFNSLHSVKVVQGVTVFR
jgi:hypothetical protein